MSPKASSLRFLQAQPDTRLVELSHAGHERAFEAVVRRYRWELLAYCRRLTAAEAGAEDVLQQALLQAWVAIRRDGDIRDVRAWLYQIVHNVAVSNFRRTAVDEVQLQPTAGSDGADFEAEKRIAAREALAGVAALPQLQRQVMLSTALEGRSHDEIAASLGLSRGSVRGLIYRARAKLRAAAATLIPGPVITWASRQEVRGGTGGSRLIETVAGGGSAGIGGLAVKGMAIMATAGALAGAAGLNAIHGGRSARRSPSGPALRAARGLSRRERPAVAVASTAAPGMTASATSGRGAAHAGVELVSAAGSSRTSAGFNGADQPGSFTRHTAPNSTPSRAGGGQDGRLGIGGSGSGGSTRGGSGATGRKDGMGGHDGGLNSGPNSGTSSGGSTTGDGHDGGIAGGHDGGIAGGHDGGASGGTDGGPTATVADGSFDGGPSSGSDGGPSSGSDGGPSSGSDGGPSSGFDGGPSGGSDAGSPGATNGASPDGGPSDSGTAGTAGSGSGGWAGPAGGAPGGGS